MNQFWLASLEDTVKLSERFPAPHHYISEWLNRYSEGHPTSSNQGVFDVPFQRWFHFKEAFSPKFVTDTLGSLPYDIKRCVDPFGGSGTTAVSCRMLGVRSVSTEVNPFLADIIKAKVTPVDPQIFLSQYRDLIRTMRVTKGDKSLPKNFPPTMCEPGSKGRYIFSQNVFGTIRAIVRKSNDMGNDYARLLRILLGSVLVSNSNVRINGKGRRYRGNWNKRQSSKGDLLLSLEKAVCAAVEDLIIFRNLPKGDNRVILGDARVALSNVKTADVAIFSPPYPNSFDYTDVYNIELWVLGYLENLHENRQLRQRTLRSHVQTKWQKPVAQLANSPTLRKVVNELDEKRDQLWDGNLPQMVQLYFDDLYTIFKHLQRILPLNHHAVVAIGDSQYAGVLIDVSKILPEVVHDLGFRVSEQGAIRSMRSSSQHGGRFELSEHCIVFERVN